jgi:hypothetical protein
LHEIDAAGLRAATPSLDAGDEAPQGAPAEGEASLPAQLSQYERRQPRVAVTVPVEVSAKGAAKKAELRELSLNGALLIAPMQFAVNERIEIVAMQGKVRAAATVRNERPNGAGFGIEFDSKQEDLFKEFAPKN